MKFTEGVKRLIGVVVVFCLGAGPEAAELALGDVKVDAPARTISFPAQVNQRTGQIEYLVVHETGKVHESIFKSSVAPKQVHAAALLFSKTNGATLKIAAIEVFWKEKKFAAAELILDKAKKRPLRETNWAYRGSRLVDRVFLAEREGSIVAVREDRDALVDQDTPDAADDENWEPVKELVPEIGTAVTIVIRFTE
jgi:hypothetical protein